MRCSTVEMNALFFLCICMVKFTIHLIITVLYLVHIGRVFGACFCDLFIEVIGILRKKGFVMKIVLTHVANLFRDTSTVGV